MLIVVGSVVGNVGGGDVWVTLEVFPIVTEQVGLCVHAGRQHGSRGGALPCPRAQPHAFAAARAGRDRAQLRGFARVATAQARALQRHRAIVGAETHGKRSQKVSDRQRPTV